MASERKTDDEKALDAYDRLFDAHEYLESVLAGIQDLCRRWPESARSSLLAEVIEDWAQRAVRDQYSVGSRPHVFEAGAPHDISPRWVAERAAMGMTTLLR